MKEEDRYKSVKSFWDYHEPWSRMQYLRDWRIYRTNGLHSQCARCDWDDLTPFEKETIYKAHKAAVANHE